MTSYTAPANWNPIFDPKKFIEIPTANIDTDINTDGILTEIYNLNAEADEQLAVLNEFGIFYGENIPLTGLASGIPNTIYNIQPIISSIGIYYINATINFTIPAGIAWQYIAVWINCSPYTSQYAGANLQQARLFYNTKNNTNGTLSQFCFNTSYIFNCAVAPTTFQIISQLYSPTATTYSAFVNTNAPGGGQGVAVPIVTFVSGTNPYIQ